MDSEIPLRITVVNPPQDVDFCLQRGRAELVSRTRSDGQPLSFDFTVRARLSPDGESVNLTGPFAQGPPAGRFVYVNSGTLAGQADSCWTRRAKVPLTGITRALVEALLASPGSWLEARIPGMARDGGPASATVPLLGEGWSLATERRTRP